ncbi:MAG: hypothetical protein IT294_14110 [Deltaproteobacteria bacterium]|nr:hypothetical protein [Deltaproteobacteria bacterium]
MRSLGIALWLGCLVAAARADAAATPAPAGVRWEDGRLSVRVVDAPLDRVLVEIAAATRAALRGEVEARSVTIDFTALPVADGLARLLGAESFMLTYAADGSLRTIDLLTRGVPVTPAPSVGTTSSPRPPLADEEEQAVVLQRPVAVAGPLAAAVGGDAAPIGLVLHVAVGERDPAARAAARDVALAAFARDPEVEAAYLSTLAPVDDVVLARILHGAAADPRGVEEWLAALAGHAPSAALRAKAAAVLAVLPR